MSVTQRLVLQAIPLNLGDIPQAHLDIEVKTRANLLPWRGQFSPQLVQALIERYAASDGIVLDPFAGSGTVLYEAGRHDLRALGVEINPAACVLARTYELMNFDRQSRRALLEEIDHLLEEHIPRPMPLLDRAHGQLGSKEVTQALCRLHPKVANDSSRALLETLMVKVDFSRTDITDQRIFREWQAIRAMAMALPESDRPVRVLNCDARAMPLPDHIVDLVITSPPYINVHNYHEQYRRSAEALGWRLLKVAQSEIGANRKHRVNRFLTVVQYCLDMTQALSEITRVAKPGARIIAVVGRESTVRGIPFDNGEMVAQLGVACTGLTLLTRQERVFTNRFGERIYEDILHFIPGTNSQEDPLQRARSVAQDFLTRARSKADAPVCRAVEAALRAVETVQPSPIYDSAKAHQTIT